MAHRHTHGADALGLAALQRHQDVLHADVASLGAADPATAAVSAADIDRKRQADLQARAALAGIALHRLADGSWLAHKWNLSKGLADTEVEAWLSQVGARG
jgi:hypothetical protein